MISDKSLIRIIFFGLLSILPAVLLLLYITIFGVNVIFWDEWEMIPLFEKAFYGTLKFSDLYIQHNEHRIFFPKIVMIAIGIATQYNTIFTMFFSFILICLNVILIFHIYLKKFFWIGLPESLIMFFPISLLLFSFRQHESILWSFTCQIYLMLFGAVLTFSLLELSKKIDFKFFLSFFSAIFATFSFLTGIMIWPVGFIQILISNRKNYLKKAFLWCFVGILTLILYFNGYKMPSHYSPINNMLAEPMDALKYILTLIGAGFSFNSFIAMPLGAIIILISAIIIRKIHMEKIFRENGIWFSFLLFSGLASLSIMAGRVQIGVDQAISSRYAPITTLGIIGLYLLAISLSKKTGIRNRIFGPYALLVFILFSAIISYSIGWQVGLDTAYSREKGAYILSTYETQTDENIRNYLYPVPEMVRERTNFLEKNKLNVFNKEYYTRINSCDAR